MDLESEIINSVSFANVPDDIITKFHKLQDTTKVVLFACEKFNIVFLQKALSIEHIDDVISTILYEYTTTNHLNIYGQTPIIVACSNNFTEMAKLLIKRSSINCIDTVDKDGNTALIHSIKNNNTELATFLLEYGAYPNITNNDNESALSYAKKLNQDTIIDKLLCAGAGVQIPFHTPEHLIKYYHVNLIN